MILASADMTIMLRCAALHSVFPSHGIVRRSTRIIGLMYMILWSTCSKIRCFSISTRCLRLHLGILTHMQVLNNWQPRQGMPSKQLRSHSASGRGRPTSLQRHGNWWTGISFCSSNSVPLNELSSLRCYRDASLVGGNYTKVTLFLPIPVQCCMI